jgi:hypothetical protein
MSRDVEISNERFAPLESCVKRKLCFFVPSGLMLCVLLQVVKGSANILEPGVGIATGYGLDYQGGREFDSR